MNITIVCDVLGEENNGTTITTANLIRAMRERGHKVNVLCCDIQHMGDAGYYICPARSFGIFNGYFKKVGVRLAKPVKSIVEQAICDADVVHCMLPFALSQCAVKVAKKMGKPITAGFHCQAENFSSHIWLKNSATVSQLTYRYFYDRVYSKVDCIHYPSQMIRDIFESSTSKTNGVVISNGVSDDIKVEKKEKPSDKAGKFVVLSIGRYSREKCHDILIRAVGLSKYREKICLIIAGKGSLDRRYHTLASKYGVDLYLQFFPRHVLNEVLGYSDLYVHPADIELEGIATLEAMHCGLPIIVSDSTRASTSRLAMDERNLFRANDAGNLSEKIDYWVENECERLKCGDYYAQSKLARPAKECMNDMEKMFRSVVGESVSV